MGSSPFIRTTRTHPPKGAFLRGADEVLTRTHGSREQRQLRSPAESSPFTEFRQIPFIRTSKIDKFRQGVVDFPYLYKLLMLTKKVGSGLLTKKQCML